MRFIVFMIPKLYQGGKKLDPNFAPELKDMEKMMAFNKELGKEVTLLALDGLKPPSEGTRIDFSSGKPSATDGPFAESKEVVGGYWILEAKSKAQVVEWMKRCPAAKGDVLEIRPIFELEDFAADAQEAVKAAK